MEELTGKDCMGGNVSVNTMDPDPQEGSECSFVNRAEIDKLSVSAFRNRQSITCNPKIFLFSYPAMEAQRILICEASGGQIHSCSAAHIEEADSTHDTTNCRDG